MGQLATGATITFGSTVVAAITDISGPSLTRETQDVTAHDCTDDWRDHIKGVKTGGEITFTINYLADNVTHQLTNTGLVGDFDDSFNALTMNSGFESGILRPWTKVSTPSTSEVSSTRAHDGTYSYHIAGTDGQYLRYNGATGIVTTASAYVLSCWVWPVSGYGAVRLATDLGGSYADVAATANGAWERLSISVETATAAAHYVHLAIVGAAAEAYYDSVMLQQTTSLKDYVYELGTSTVTIGIPAPEGAVDFSFPGAVTAFSPNLPVEGQASADVTMMVMGKPTLA